MHAGLSGQFRTPTLRNVAVTAPYFHNGQTDRLIDAVQHPQRLLSAADATPADPLAADEAGDLAAFLITLTDADGSRRPWNPAGLTRCP